MLRNGCGFGLIKDIPWSRGTERGFPPLSKEVAKMSEELRKLLEALENFETTDPEVKELADRLISKLSKWFRCEVEVKVFVDAETIPFSAMLRGQSIDVESQLVTAEMTMSIVVFVQAATAAEAEAKVRKLEGTTFPAFALKIGENTVGVGLDEIERVRILEVKTEEVTAVEAVRKGTSYEAHCPFCGKVYKRFLYTMGCPHFVGKRTFLGPPSKTLIFFSERGK